MWADARGRIYDCKTLTRVGDERLADEICGILVRLRVRPSKDSTGKPLVSNVVTTIKFTVPGTPVGDRIDRMAELPDVVIDRPRPPGSRPEGSHKVRLAVEIGPEGAVVACNGDKKAEKKLAEVACAGVASRTFEQGLDKEGNRTSYVRAMEVGLAAMAQ